MSATSKNLNALYIPGDCHSVFLIWIPINYNDCCTRYNPPDRSTNSETLMSWFSSGSGIYSTSYTTNRNNKLKTWVLKCLQCFWNACSKTHKWASKQSYQKKHMVLFIIESKHLIWEVRVSHFFCASLLQLCRKGPLNKGVCRLPWSLGKSSPSSLDA